MWLNCIDVQTEKSDSDLWSARPNRADTTIKFSILGSYSLIWPGSQSFAVNFLIFSIHEVPSMTVFQAEFWHKLSTKISNASLIHVATPSSWTSSTWHITKHELHQCNSPPANTPFPAFTFFTSSLHSLPYLKLQRDEFYRPSFNWY